MNSATTFAPAPRLASRHRPRRLGPRILLVAIGLFIVAIVYCGSALIKTPGWYRPPMIPPESQQKVRNSLIAAEQAFTRNVAAGHSFIYHLYQEDLNRWLAMRREIYPRVDELFPPGVSDPFVVISPESVTLAIRYQTAWHSTVVSMEFDVVFRDDAIELAAKSVRCGNLRLPKNLEALKLDRRIVLDRNGAWPGSPQMQGDLLSGLRLDSRSRWKNGGVEYRVTNLSLLPGRIDFSIEPLGR
ncbi:MAG: hypothetical protein KF841_06760 [Phycisphaerae bacterium]|nr:hypothetical protein [Phycisphaerae bacterium]